MKDLSSEIIRAIKCKIHHVSNMEHFGKIKCELPNFPDDVIEQWLVPFSEDLGWPPKRGSCGCIYGGGDGWYGIFRGKNLEYLKNLDWRKEKIALTPHVLFG